MIVQLHSMLINVLIIGFDEGFNNHKTTTVYVFLINSRIAIACPSV